MCSPPTTSTPRTSPSSIFGPSSRGSRRARRPPARLPWRLDADFVWTPFFTAYRLPARDDRWFPPLLTVADSSRRRSAPSPCGRAIPTSTRRRTPWRRRTSRSASSASTRGVEMSLTSSTVGTSHRASRRAVRRPSRRPAIRRPRSPPSRTSRWYRRCIGSPWSAATSPCRSCGSRCAPRRRGSTDAPSPCS